MASTVHYKFEDILARVGDQNKWQIMIFLFTWIEGCLIGFHHLSSSFLGASPDHWCNLDYVSALDNVAWNETMKKEYAVPRYMHKINQQYLPKKHQWSNKLNKRRKQKISRN